MKKTLISAAIITTLIVGGAMSAQARPWGSGSGPGYGYCDNYGRGYGAGYEVSETEKKAFTEFRQETVELRKNIAVKRAELDALMEQENPDSKKVGQLAGELFELRNELKNKAQEKGVAIRGGRFCDETNWGGRHRGGHHRGRGMNW